MPRFSQVAIVSVLVVIATGVGASLIHLPTLASLWETSYGKAILVKVGLLAVALVLGGLNSRAPAPAGGRARAARPRPGRSGARCCGAP